MGKYMEVTSSQFDRARRAFFGILSRRMSPQFIERHGEDLFAQAAFEYSRRIAEGNEIHSPVAWINVCGWHRTISLLEAQARRPRIVSSESLAELPAGAATPEEEILTEDRFRKVREAVGLLPDYQQELLELSYFEGKSVRAAARQLGWTPSKAQRAHEAAQRRLRKLLGDESNDAL
jgi:RNA polymerase sigma factor (sigma-70 family)